MTQPAPRYRVELRQFPLDLYREAWQHHEELMREFALIRVHLPEASEAHSVPSRLLRLIDELTQQYAGATQEVDQRRALALDRRETEIDLCYHVPAQARAASEHLRQMLEEADEYCRQGRHLLTLATPPDAVAFRTWYLTEFIDQIDGAPPTPWPVYAELQPARPS